MGFAGLLLATALWAAGPTQTVKTSWDDSTERYVRDLASQNAGTRLFAARALKSRLRVSLRDSERAPEGSFERDDALLVLDAYDTLVAPACLSNLEVENLARPCAVMLGLLETESARAPLEALAARSKGCTRRAARRALDRLPEPTP